MPREHKDSGNSGHQGEATDVSYFPGFDQKKIIIRVFI